MLPALLLSGLLAQAPAAAQPEHGARALAADGGTVDEGGTIKLRGAAEAAVEVMPSGPPGGGYDGFIKVHPVFALSASDDFQVVLGPSFRFRLVDTPPLQRANDFGGVLRREDWDTASDFGQILESLRIAPDSSPFLIRAGAVHKKTLGLGHLLSRYSNSENPDYHPAAGTAVLAVGPVRGEFFASDIFAGRILAGDLAWDLGATFSRSPDVGGRYVIALELVHDMARAGLPRVPAECAAPDAGCVVMDPARLPLTLLGLDGSVVLLRQEKLKLMLLAAFGSRANAQADLGLALGGAADITVGEIALSLKLELRKQGGGFRQGMIGPQYELARFAGLGFAGVPLGEERLPDSWSLYAELRTAIGRSVVVDGYAEYYVWGRTDFDASASVTLLNNWLVAAARVSGLGLGVQPRYAASANVFLRLFPSFYLVGSTGTVMFPQLDGTLSRGMFITAGAGFDFER